MHVCVFAPAPILTVTIERGSGDAGELHIHRALAYGRAKGLPPTAALSLAVAAGAVNVTRHGLGSGDAETIAQLAENVQIETLERSR